MEKKTVYRKIREELGLSREEACDLLGCITVDKLVRIENGKQKPSPADIIFMAQRYGCPHLCNYYCANECEIGVKTVPQIKPKQLSQIVLEILASLNTIEKEKDRLVEIAVDGKITSDELADLLHIRDELGGISATVSALRLWVDEMMAHGARDKARSGKMD